MASILAFFWSVGGGADVGLLAPRCRYSRDRFADGWNSGGWGRLVAWRRCRGAGEGVAITGPGGWTGAGGTALTTGAGAAK